MLTATRQCGAVKVEVPREPETLTECNCAIRRRYGVLCAYYSDAEVTLTAAPDATEDYAWGDKTLKFIRCKHCGCVVAPAKFKKLSRQQMENAAYAQAKLSQ